MDEGVARGQSMICPSGSAASSLYAQVQLRRLTSTHGHRWSRGPLRQRGLTPPARSTRGARGRPRGVARTALWHLLGACPKPLAGATPSSSMTAHPCATACCTIEREERVALTATTQRRAEAGARCRFCVSWVMAVVEGADGSGSPVRSEQPLEQRPLDRRSASASSRMVPATSLRDGDLRALQTEFEAVATPMKVVNPEDDGLVLHKTEIRLLSVLWRSGGLSRPRHGPAQRAAALWFDALRRRAEATVRIDQGAPRRRAPRSEGGAAAHRAARSLRRRQRHGGPEVRRITPRAVPHERANRRAASCRRRPHRPRAALRFGAAQRRVESGSTDCLEWPPSDQRDPPLSEQR